MPSLQRSALPRGPSDASVEPMKVQETGVPVCAVTSRQDFQGPRGSSWVCFLFGGSRAQSLAGEVSPQHWAAHSVRWRQLRPGTRLR